MQIRIFSLPLPGSEKENETLNAFLRNKKILQVESEIVQSSTGSFWCFCVRYLEDTSPQRAKKVDYKELLDKESFARFMTYREIRKRVARESGIPAYFILSDKEMAELAKIKDLTLAKMKKIKGIGEGKLEKYGTYFISSSDEAHKSPD